MILSVTMNPSVDISYPVPTLKLDDVNRVEHVRKTAGGKGLNVARVIAQMGEDVVATGILGGTIGAYIVQELNKGHIPNDFMKTDKESRNCIAILHEGMQTEILEPGPTFSFNEGATFLEKFEGMLSKFSIVTVSGSLPKGLPTDFYYQMLQICHKKEIPLIVDTSGGSLREVLLHKEKPFVIKPNMTELSQLLDIDVKMSMKELKQALCHDLFYGIEWIIVSMGSEGAFVKHKGDFYRVTIPKVDVVNPVGSGDATVAGLAIALKQKQPVETVLKTAMTTGMLNSMEAETGFINVKAFQHYFELVKIEKL